MEFKSFSNQEIQAYGVAEGIVEANCSAQDVVTVLLARSDYRGELLDVIVSANNRGKKGRGKHPTQTGEVAGASYSNPKDYLDAVRSELLSLIERVRPKPTPHFDSGEFVDKIVGPNAYDINLVTPRVNLSRLECDDLDEQPFIVLDLPQAEVSATQKDRSEKLGFLPPEIFAQFTKATGTEDVGKAPDYEIGHYDENNRTLAYVDPEGDYWVARKTRELVAALREAGYKLGCHVPHSNDGGRWMRKNVDEVSARRTEKAKEEAALSAARQRAEKIRALAVNFDKERYFANAVGSYEMDGGYYRIVEEGSELEVGFYNANYGVIAFVDENRQRWVAPYTIERAELLRQFGYEAGIAALPHSMGYSDWKREKFAAMAA